MYSFEASDNSVRYCKKLEKKQDKNQRERERERERESEIKDSVTNNQSSITLVSKNIKIYFERVGEKERYK